jgi:GNAT superfamily N-acetyltransferase
MRPDDAGRIAEFVARLSPEARRLRFFTPVRRLEARFIEHLVNMDFVTRAAFVVTFPGSDDILAVGRYEAESEDSAEVAFVVQDELQGQGVATELLHHLAVLARANGLSRFTALMLAENTDMLHVFQHSGYPITVKFEGGVELAEMEIGERREA